MTATRYTLAVGEYVWAVHPDYPGRRVSVIVRLYTRGEHDEHARVRLVQWSEASPRGVSFLVPVSHLDAIDEMSDKHRVTLDALNQAAV